MRRPFSAALPVLIVLAVVSGGAAPAQSRRFMSDDPLMREPDSQNAATVAPWTIDLITDLALNLFVRMGDKTPDAPSGNVNTIDEVPASSWFTNRIGAQPVTIAQAAKGPIEHPAPAPGRWMVIAAKRA